MSTTHPLQEKLFIELFKPISIGDKIYKWPESKSYRGRQLYYWTLRAYIHPKYSSMLRKLKYVPQEYINDVRLLSAFTAGLTDADGSITIEKSYSRAKPLFKIVNKNYKLLKELQEGWKKYGIYIPELHINKNVGNGYRKYPTWELRTRGRKVYLLLSRLKPHIRHEEHVMKIRIIEQLGRGIILSQEALLMRKQVKQLIKHMIRVYVDEAKRLLVG